MTTSSKYPSVRSIFPGGGRLGSIGLVRSNSPLGGPGGGVVRFHRFGSVNFCRGGERLGSIGSVRFHRFGLGSIGSIGSVRSIFPWGGGG